MRTAENGAPAGVGAVLFDLDGTLLDTLDDLAASANAALVQCGMPPRTREEIRAFVGNGVAKLMARAVAPGTDGAGVRAALDAFLAHYGAHSRDRTRPYDGIEALLDALSADGVRLAVVSNKIEPAVKALCAQYFGGRIEAAVGDAPERPVKPAPDGVFEAMKRLGVTAEACVYVGDSDVDVLTARNAGLRSIAVTWGFRDEALLRAAGADYIAHTPQELLHILRTL